MKSLILLLFLLSTVCASWSYNFRGRIICKNGKVPTIDPKDLRVICRYSTWGGFGRDNKEIQYVNGYCTRKQLIYFILTAF